MTQLPTTTMSARGVRLRPVVPDDYSELYLREVNGSVESSWRLQGVTPPPESYGEVLWSNTFAQFILDSDEGPKGLVSAYGLNDVAGHAYVSVWGFSGASAGLEVAIGTALFVSYLFDWRNFSKLYFEAPGYRVSQFAGVMENLLVKEAELCDHIYFQGKMWPQLTFALYRETWGGALDVIEKTLGLPARER